MLVTSGFSNNSNSLRMEFTLRLVFTVTCFIILISQCKESLGFHDDPLQVSFKICRPGPKPPKPTHPPTTTSTTTTSTTTTSTTTTPTTTSTTTTPTTTSTTTTSTTTTSTTTTTTSTTTAPPTTTTTTEETTTSTSESTTTTIPTGQPGRRRRRHFILSGEPATTESPPDNPDNDPLLQNLWDNEEHVINNMCYALSVSTRGGKLYDDDPSSTCLKDADYYPTRAKVVLKSRSDEDFVELGTLKQRRTGILEKEETNKGACDRNSTSYKHITCKRLPLEPGQQRRSNVWNYYPRYIGKIIPFALHGEKCSLENEAYLHGAALTTIAMQGDAEASIEDLPWGTLDKYWSRLINLYVGGIDTKEGGVHECTVAESNSDPGTQYYLETLYGDCIFNQRLAEDPHYSETVTLGPRAAYDMCPDYTIKAPEYNESCCEKVKSGTPPVPQLIDEYQPDDMHIGVPALGCTPYHYLFCAEEYNADLLLESTCQCHPLYTMTNDNISTGFPCLAMAGIPCSFDISNDVGNLLPREIPCAPHMECRQLRPEEAGQRWTIFQYSFAGFAMSPIARDYLVSKATGMCDCNLTSIRTMLNECQAIGEGDMLSLSNFLLTISAFYIFAMN